ncbi:MAG: hypothetical protein HFJ50_07560 [Clostridia bacterium]|jgi:hypothetical protein|nr:hypothetical protein [Clostridia bacterium]
MHGIKVLDRLIVIQTEKGEEYYVIEDGQILRANLEEKEPVKINIVGDKKNLPALRKDGIFSKISDLIRRGLYKNKEDRFQEESASPYSDKGSRKEEFRRNLRDMTRYDENIYEDTNTVIPEQEKEER